ncbi:metallopeptidase family protein [Oceaniglobus trochenteri]|uniref:metallopeptidase family protein n=1 Tax=Oceaniglobus trochenteri TaxID=2763260 RepID=UPI001CFFE1C2|nr:metallopeptidase family protein [Oceaniglobus trochenteri]
MDDTPDTAPDLALIESLAEAARAALPAPFRDGAMQVLLRVEDFAPDHILRDMQIDDPFELTGLYDGIPLTQKSVLDQPTGPDTIWLFRRPILDEWAARGDIGLADLVTHVLVHEMAHHFGWDDDDIASVDRWWE